MKKINELISFLETCEHQKQLQVETQTVLKYCKEIQAEQLALCSVSKWVAVKDKLPEERKTVLVYTSEHGTATAIFTNGNWRVRGLPIMTEVTHWMDRPKPPCY